MLNAECNRSRRSRRRYHPWGPIKAGTRCPGYRFSILTRHRRPCCALNKRASLRTHTHPMLRSDVLTTAE